MGGLLSKLKGGKQAEQTTQMLSRLKSQQIEQFEQALQLKQTGSKAEAEKIFQQLRKTLGEKTFSEVEQYILPRAGSLEPGNPNSTSLPRNGKKEVLNQMDAPEYGSVACGPTSCGMVLNDAGKPINLGTLVE